MPLCTLHLLALHPTTPNPLHTFLSTLKSSTITPLVISRVIRWIILPTQLSTEHLLARNTRWDILLILPSTEALPPQLEKLVQHHWCITAGVPSRLVKDFAAKNTRLLRPDASSVPALQNASSGAGSKVDLKESSQALELSTGLESWIHEFTQSGGKEAHGAVSMFNLLAFKDGMKEEYLKYGKAFAERVGSRHGGDAKIVGNVVAQDGQSLGDASGDGWDEIALAHYPSILHFRDMLLSEEYQDVNQRHRVGSLRDTAILMTSEVGIAEVMGGGGAKL
ncbi:hypothetical protein FB567DRAFT_442987 [Paraphoma chrysanthemicola]|uniref:DUF1330 domain-containing protein n=1 Tax=Paraphoma chrysanthemicola TaxID=798071 RepID=A0A8K0R8K8_9PLEO|nr:hypothetical protein FB567DRAFT_442987 [Paraphoma chrysanthemicola]